MHAPERYRELLDAFRAEHSEFKDVPFSLRVCHWADPPRITPGEPWNEFLKNCVMVLDKSPGEVMPIGTVSFPVVDPRWLSYAIAANPKSEEQMARECGDEIMRVSWRSCVVYAKTFKPEQRRAVESFVNLAKAAGTALPLSIREAIPQQANIADAESNAYLDRWLNLMFWSNPPELEELLTLNQWGGGRDLFWKPLSNAADVIERCRLTTDSPKFVTKGNLWPRWAGQVPPSLLQVDYKPAADAVTVESPKITQQATESADDDNGKQTASDETGGHESRRKRKSVGPHRTTEELFKAALRTHHKYENGSVLNHASISTRDVEKLMDSQISDSTARLQFIRHFGSVKKYQTACLSGTINAKLVVLLGDALHAFGSFDPTSGDVEDAEDE